MLFTCPCLNVHLNIEINDQYSIDKIFFNELNDENLFDVNKLKQFCFRTRDNIKYEHKELIGLIKRDLYTIYKCVCCNIFTHIQLNKLNQNILLINEALLINEKSDIDALRNNQNYSTIFKVILNSIALSSLVYLNKELRPLASYMELKEFSNFIELQLAQMLPQSEEEKLKYFNRLVLKLMHAVNENTSQESLESGFIEDNNSNSSINSQQLNQSSQASTGDNKLLTFRYRTWSENSRNSLSVDKTKLQKPIETGDNLFTFEDAFNEDDNSVQPFNEDIDLDMDENFELESDKPVREKPPNVDVQVSQYQMNTSNHKRNDNAFKYSCSVPRNIPMFSRSRENSSTAAVGKQFSYVDDYTFGANMREKTVDYAGDVSIGDEREPNDGTDDDPDNVGQAIAELASSIVHKDGRELFGDRPSRTISIRTISKNCYDN